MKVILFLSFVLFPLISYCQKKEIIGKSTPFPFLHHDTSKYVKVTGGTIYRYEHQDSVNKNVKILKINGHYIYEEIGYSDRVIVYAECETVLYQEGFSTVATGDSIKKGEINGDYLCLDGKIPSEIVYFRIELAKNGKYFVYYSNGLVKVKGHYKNGFQYGEWKYYNLDKKLTKKEWYHNGDLLRTVTM